MGNSPHVRISQLPGVDREEHDSVLRPISSAAPSVTYRTINAHSDLVESSHELLWVPKRLCFANAIT